MDKVVNTLKKLYKAYIVLRTPFRKTTHPDSPILRLHYEFMPIFFFMMFSTVLGHWPEADQIKCFSRYDRSEPDGTIYDYCLYYGYATLGEEKAYPLFYRYTHWIFLSQVLIYGVLRLVMYSKRKARLSALLENLKNIPFDEEESTELLVLNDKLKQSVISYFDDYFESESRGYCALFFIFHVTAFLLNSFAFFILDFLLQKRYHGLMYHISAFRDYHFFQDQLSFSFPHFVDCDITPTLHVLVNRKEYLGCQLSYMVWFEKYFVIIYILQLLTTLATIIYIVFKVAELALLKNIGRIGYEPHLTLSKLMIVQQVEKCVPHEFFKQIILKIGLSCQGDQTTTELILDDSFEKM